MVGPPISSGFPSPAEDYEEPPLDLHNLVVANPLATYFMEMDSDEHVALGVQRGDILTVDRSLEPAAGRLVVVVADEGLRLLRWPAAEPMEVWGVVTWITRRV